MAKPTSFNRPAKAKSFGSTSFNFGANRGKKSKGAAKRGGGGKGGGS